MEAPILDDLRKAYAELAEPPANADGNWLRQRGYRFESLLNDVFTAEGLEPRTSYKAAGEQIDGSFFLNASVFLLEAKWHKDPLPASTLYQFKGKVDGKLVGTKGVFISMSGYSEDAVDALTLGKSLNLILFDKKDLDAAITRNLGFRNVLKLKLRKAAEEGLVYFPTEMDVVTRDGSKPVEIECLHYDSVTGGVFTSQPTPASASDLLIVCEGDIDRVVIAALAERILSGAISKRKMKITVAMGKYSIPKVANGLWSLHPAAKAMIVVDGDGNPQASLAMLKKGLMFDDWTPVIPNPSIESWLNLDRERMRRLGMTARFDEYRQAVARLDMQRLREDDQSFAAFYDAIIGS
jgi:Restriction endonuclease